MNLKTMIFVFGLGFAASASHAAFINGQETFTGTVLDASTWRAIYPFANAATISQNNALTIAAANAINGAATYETTGVQVGVGGYFQVHMDVTSLYGTSGNTHYAFVGLASGESDLLLDSRHIDMTEDFRTAYIGGVQYPSLFEAWAGNSSGSSGYPLKPGFGPQLNTDYILRIDRPTADTAVFSTYAADGTPINTYTYNLGVSYGNLYVGLGAYAADATFSDVQVGTAAPLPATMWGGAGLLAALVGFRVLRRRTNERGGDGWIRWATPSDA